MLTINDIKKIIPHRAPFLLIDKVEEIVPGEKAIAYKNVTFNEYFFEGHFPQEPVMPGVLIIEALAQTGAVAILSLEELKGKIAYFGGIKNARFRDKVIPGDVLRLEVEIIKRRGPIGVGKATATVDGKVVTECELTFVVGE
ncbi:MAG: 3-hydroxyacyl-[acyl-carrier-protein] dehydratase FabZ [Firmicutes bacterium HGW-Firmicutes-7]|nr:MAG: 3-hydroxyacyl-[acyl-carrier-protein] dehydratase FabZ [Firmicutes bacterium HGW-Firmicutes-7]